MKCFVPCSATEAALTALQRPTTSSTILSVEQTQAAPSTCASPKAAEGNTKAESLFGTTSLSTIVGLPWLRSVLPEFQSMVGSHPIRLSL